MSVPPQDPTSGAGGRQPTEEEMRAALEAEMKRITVDDVLVQTVVSLVNLGGRRAGLAPGTEGERDLDQVQTAIEAVQALLPLLERHHPEEVRPVRDALSQLQLAYARPRRGRTSPTASRRRRAPRPERTRAPPSEAGACGSPGSSQSVDFAPLCRREAPFRGLTPAVFHGLARPRKGRAPNGLRRTGLE
jgi:hypothetical protein